MCNTEINNFFDNSSIQKLVCPNCGSIVLISQSKKKNQRHKQRNKYNKTDSATHKDVWIS